MLHFPGLDEIRRQNEIRIGRRFLRCIDHHRFANEVRGGNGIDRVVRQILARDPMHRGIEVGAGVLAGSEVFQCQATPRSS